ncbi:MAG: hypothetical protein ACYC6O_06320 [Thermoleophilia bacterium]
MPRIKLCQHHSVQTFLKIVLSAAVAVALVLMASSCSDEKESSNSFDIGTGPITATNKGPISKDVVEKLVARKLGDAGVAGQPVIRSITLTPGATGTDLAIDLNRTASCHSGALVGTAVTMAQQLMSAIFRYPDVSKISLTLYGPTEDLKDKDLPAVKIVVTKDAAAKIDWFQFSELTVGTLATEYWLEPCVEQSYKLYGGATITDPALLEQANAACSSTTAAP